jgi:uncharacterized protein DUF3761
MRRTLSVVGIGLLLLYGSACGTKPTTANTTHAAPSTTDEIIVEPTTTATYPPVTVAVTSPPTTAATVYHAPVTSAPVCPNGSYVNSSGDNVCSPYASPGGPPAGATAQCRDGTYSFSQHRSGTCSGHGSVDRWL